MSDAATSADEGANPIHDIKKQNPGETTTGDQRSEAADGSSGEASDDPHKIEELTKAGHKNFATENRNE